MAANITQIENTLCRRVHRHTRKHLLRCYKDYRRLSELMVEGHSLEMPIAERQWTEMGRDQVKPLEWENPV
ncbi:hypothetical protein I79_007422 [Cricetulus griseus]|uniref:Uncharacterized protein n=1 Tax=Cricetulus griseus TaxID=10029 RepID=G3HAH0_CRIGR|nr:hypothetical protein I79_007422 [Cricetulus griseus]